MSEAKILSRAEILAAKDIKTETVAVPEWGGAVVVRALDGKQRDAFEESVMIKGKKGSVDIISKRMRVKLLAIAIVDEKGAPLFTEDDVELLAGKSAAAIDRVFKVAQSLSGLAEEQVQEAVEVLKDAPLGGSATA